MCWGWNRFGQLDAPPGRYTAIDAGYAHTCALADTGEVVCWSDGQADAPPGRYATLSVDYGAGCALTGDGDALCWGYLANTPPPGRRYSAIDVGSSGRQHVRACALTVAGEVDCWGGGWGGDGEPGAPPGRYLAISVSENRACALTDGGDIACWGDVWYEDTPIYI